MAPGGGARALQRSPCHTRTAGQLHSQVSPNRFTHPPRREGCEQEGEGATLEARQRSACSYAPAGTAVILLSSCCHPALQLQRLTHLLGSFHRQPCGAPVLAPAQAQVREGIADEMFRRARTGRRCGIQFIKFLLF